jgi:hypothetical protein
MAGSCAQAGAGEAGTCCPALSCLAYGLSVASPLPMAWQHTVQRDLEALGLPLHIGPLSALCADWQGWRAMLYALAHTT